MVSVLHVESLLRNFDVISSGKYNKSPFPFEFLYNLHGVQNPLNLSWDERNESSSLDSEISNTSILVSMMKDNASNLFLIESIFIPYKFIPYFWALHLRVFKSNFCIKNIVVFSTIGLILL